MIRRVSRDRFHRRSALRHLRRVSLLRVILLASVLISANVWAAWTMSVPASAHAIAASTHHCEEAETAAPSPAHGPSEHGTSCACCHDGCLCMHACGAVAPDILALCCSAPEPMRAAHARPNPPAPPGAELLRPPIA